MIPSRAWFPGTLQERVAWFNNFSVQFSTVGLSLGFTAPEVLVVENDNELMQYLGVTTTAIDAFVDAFRQYRIVVTEGAIGDPTPAYPPNPTGIGTGAIPTGIFERLVNLVERIRVAPAYTPEIGALLGIIPQSSSGPSPENDLKPVIKASESYGGFAFMVNVTRLGQPLFKVQTQKQGQATWSDAVTTNKNPATVSVTPTAPNQPERILVRALLLNGETVVGVPSDPTYVTVNP